MYAKKHQFPGKLAIKKNWSNDPKLGNFQMWLITPGQSLRSSDLLHIQDSFNTFPNTISGIIDIHVVRISYLSVRLLLQTLVEFGLMHIMGQQTGTPISAYIYTTCYVLTAAAFITLNDSMNNSLIPKKILKKLFTYWLVKSHHIHFFKNYSLVKSHISVNQML